jgi:hypothetical protein
VEEGELTIDQPFRKMKLICESLKSLDEEELYWYKRVHGILLLKGDNDTNFSIEVQMGGN